jgi:bifunctional UDP-N-acetylglucosamine pyrophosphorylase/glucosamine-1-phosphate N-acetyltransferase
MIIKHYLECGVYIVSGDGVTISPGTEIGAGTVILPGTTIIGNSSIGENCIIGPNSFIKDSCLGNNVSFKASFADNSDIGDECTIGPFANLRPDSKLEDKVKIGDFVEIKNSTIGRKTSVSHLTYIGDSDVGSSVNFGCGVVTVNYDGRKKHRAKIGNNVFIGCNANLVSPVTVSDNSYIAAGSTITDDIPEYALAIARERQINKEDWVKNR